VLISAGHTKVIAHRRVQTGATFLAITGKGLGQRRYGMLPRAPARELKRERRAEKLERTAGNPEPDRPHSLRSITNCRARSEESHLGLDCDVIQTGSGHAHGVDHRGALSRWRWASRKIAASAGTPYVPSRFSTTSPAPPHKGASSTANPCSTLRRRRQPRRGHMNIVRPGGDGRFTRSGDGGADPFRARGD